MPGQKQNEVKLVKKYPTQVPPSIYRQDNITPIAFLPCGCIQANHMALKSKAQAISVQLY